MTVVDAIGAAGAVLTTVCWLPQTMKIAREKDARAISLPATIAMTMGILLWLIYGIALADWPLIASNAVTLVLTAAMVGLKLRHS